MTASARLLLFIKIRTDAEIKVAARDALVNIKHILRGRLKMAAKFRKRRQKNRQSAINGEKKRGEGGQVGGH
jgi:hypothetical protein